MYPRFCEPGISCCVGLCCVIRQKDVVVVRNLSAMTDYCSSKLRTLNNFASPHHLDDQRSMTTTKRKALAAPQFHRRVRPRRDGNESDLSLPTDRSSASIASPTKDERLQDQSEESSDRSSEDEVSVRFQIRLRQVEWK